MKIYRLNNISDVYLVLGVISCLSYEPTTKPQLHRGALPFLFKYKDIGYRIL